MAKRTAPRRVTAPPPAPAPGRAAFPRPFALALLAVLALAAYANGLTGDFVLDSRVIVLEDPRVREVSAANLRLTATQSYWWPYRTDDTLYRPVTTLSYLVNYAVLGNGVRPFGYHLVNVLLHAGNVLLACLIAFRLSRSVHASIALAAIWAVHPLATDAVTNIVGRADLLAALGVLGAFYAHLRASESAAVRPTWLVTGAFAAALGLFSKESAVAVVGLVVLYDLWLREPRRPVTALLPGWLAVGVPVLLLLAARSAVLGNLPPAETMMVDNPIAGVGFWQGLLTALAVLPRYAWLTVWPMRLSADYSYAQIPPATGTPAEWLAWISLAALVAAAVTAGRRRPLVAFSAASAFVAMLPASNLLFATGTIMGERLAYLPMLGFLGCLGMAGAWAADRARVPPRVALGLAGVLVLLLTARTWARNADWESDLAVWQAAVEAAPESFKAHQGYADALYDSDPDRGRLADVVAHSHRSADIVGRLPDDRSVTRVYRLAAVYALEYGDQLRARNGDAADPESGTMYEAGVRYAQRHVDVVMATGARATPATPVENRGRELADAYRLLATAHERASDGEAAIVAAARATDLEPLNPQSYRSMAAAQAVAGRYDDAATTFIAGFMVTGDAALRESVVELYRSGLDVDGCATTSGPGGLTLNPACGPVRRHLCAASGEAVRTQRLRGRNDLAENLETAATQNFGCPASSVSRSGPP